MSQLSPQSSNARFEVKGQIYSFSISFFKRNENYLLSQTFSMLMLFLTSLRMLLNVSIYVKNVLFSLNLDLFFCRSPSCKLSWPKSSQSVIIWTSTYVSWSNRTMILKEGKGKFWLFISYFYIKAWLHLNPYIFRSHDFISPWYPTYLTWIH